MAELTMTLEELMNEVNIKDRAEFRRILKHNKLPAIPAHKLVDRSTVDKIVERLQGRKVDWYKYEVKQRDETEPGPLQQRPGIVDKAILEEWYATASRGVEFHEEDILIGIVSAGGFLQGNDSTELVLGLGPAVNILTGDRGSGKSTVLNLIGLLADSVSEETDVLVTKLLNLFKAVPDEIATFNRRVRKGMRDYGINKFASFFTVAKQVYCYYADISSQSFELIRREEGDWSSTAMSEIFNGPSMQILQQGEIIRIAEDRDKFYLQNFLDALISRSL